MPEEAIVTLIRSHVQRYAELDILDVYKLLHQGAFGPGHAIRNKRAAREWLDREAETLTKMPGEPLLESVHPEGAIVRLHLRPYVAAEGNLRKLLDAFVESGKDVQGDTAQIEAWWNTFQHLAEPGGILANRFSVRTISLVGRTRASEYWPACQHSPNYDRTYKPVYRVLRRDIAEAMLKSQKIAYTVL